MTLILPEFVRVAPRPPVAAALWQRQDVRDALADRDVAKLYRILQRLGMSQRRIAAATGQAQSEISEILAGRRVQAYDVLSRICDGLGAPRGLMGLGVCDCSRHAEPGHHPPAEGR
jgi:hypothetical protein